MTRQPGFTLIELIAVILILGILAAIALPRFVNLQGSARSSALNGLRAAVSSASTLANALQQASNLASNAAVTLEGQVVTMVNGYPAAAGGGIDAAVRFDTTLFATLGSGPMSFVVKTAPNTAACLFTYTAASGAAPAVVSTTTTSGC